MEQNTTNLQWSDITKQAEIPCYACGYLLLVCIIETITGSIHFFAPDGGAGTIAGFISSSLVVRPPPKLYIYLLCWEVVNMHL